MLKLAAMTLGLSLLACVAVAWPKPAIETSFNYFLVKGKTPRDIYADLLAHGRQVEGVDALATTNVDFTRHPVLASGPTCRMKAFSTNLNFKVGLPRLSAEATVPAATRVSWTKFASELRAHEAHHRTIWIACANRLERQVMALKSSNCESFKAAYAEISQKNLALCSAENQLFDAKERLRFLSLPFIRQATKAN